jgi:hypothetical protein
MRLLATRIALVLRRLGISWVGTPTTAALIAPYISGLVLLEGRQTQVLIAWDKLHDYDDTRKLN